MMEASNLLRCPTPNQWLQRRRRNLKPSQGSTPLLPLALEELLQTEEEAEVVVEEEDKLALRRTSQLQCRCPRLKHLRRALAQQNPLELGPLKK
mmetsp:Transcript_8588/g.13285  ORF Transcript_8588/g.13285 Transcript_8588/m.13285 type:complete len:94 (-) Transcript_8588:6655-6936(-)